MSSCKKIPLGFISAAHMCMGVQPSVEHGQTNSRYSPKKDGSSNSRNDYSSSARDKVLGISLPSMLLFCLALSYAGNHNCEFMNVTAVSGPEDSISHHFSPSCSSYILSIPSSTINPEPCTEGVDTDIQPTDDHSQSPSLSTNSKSLH